MIGTPSTTDEETFLRTIVPPEEDRRQYTLAPWSGGFRWFKSANVIPLEQYRRRRQKPGPTEPKSAA
jgi:hypothetical protein